jgi:hypothetical protein
MFRRKQEDISVEAHEALEWTRNCSITFSAELFHTEVLHEIKQTRSNLATVQPLQTTLYKHEEAANLVKVHYSGEQNSEALGERLQLLKDCWYC